MAIGNVELITRAWEQQEWKKKKATREEWEEKRKPRRPKTIARAYSPQGTLRPQAVDELLNESSTAPYGEKYNNKEHYMLLLYLRWKKYNEIK